MIGIFDSGLGGLTILKSILEKLPDYNYIYLGDNARAPYGSKSQEVIYNYTCEALDFLFAKKCRLVIIACNTASSKALRKIQQEYLPQKYPRQRVLGVIRPLVEEVASDKNIKRVGIIGTRATIESGVYDIELFNLNPELEVIQQAAPLLVPLIEEGWLNKPETTMILKKYLRPLKAKQVEALIPACTHYPFLLNDIARIMTPKCKILNPGEIVAKGLTSYLHRHPELNINKNEAAEASPSRRARAEAGVAHEAIVEFYTTDDIKTFKNLGEKFLKKPINNIVKIDLT